MSESSRWRLDVRVSLACVETLGITGFIRATPLYLPPVVRDEVSGKLRSWELPLAVLALAICSLALQVGPALSQTSEYRIHVHVVDQNFAEYDGVRVQVYRGELIDSGNTSEGTWTSKSLNADGRVYEVTVFNGHGETQTVRLTYADAYLEFALERKSPAPLLLVSNVMIAPERVMVGGNFVADLTVHNVGELDSVVGILSLNATEPFAVVGSGTVIDIGGLKVGGNRTFSVSFSVDLSARTGTYSIPYSLVYSDQNDYTFSSSGKLGVIVHGVPQVRIQDITVDPTQLNPAIDGTFTINLVNPGTENARDVTIKVLNGEELLTNSITYVGVIGRGNTKTIVFGIHVSPEASTGSRLLTIEISFKDVEGNAYSISKNYDVAVYEAQQPIPTYYYYFIAGGVAVVVGIYVALRKLGIDIW